MSSGHPQHEWGCVHGRFQPFHLGHLEYALRAKTQCRHLVVGIANPDPSWTQPEQTSVHRHEPESNPFTYLERAMMVRDSLLAASLGEKEFIVVPFPIQQPELIHYYAPIGTTHFVRIYSDWEKEKVRRLQACGFIVEVLDPGKDKEVSGTEIRELIHCGQPWEHLLPLKALKIVRRVLAIDPKRFDLCVYSSEQKPWPS